MRTYFEEDFEETSGPTDYFYARDHLLSIREVVGSDGMTIASRLGHSSWGVMTKSGSGVLSDFAFTGHYFDRPSGLGLTKYRAYDPFLARWLSRDPIGLRGGLNLYGYARYAPCESQAFANVHACQDSCLKGDPKPEPIPLHPTPRPRPGGFAAP